MASKGRMGIQVVTQSLPLLLMQKVSMASKGRMGIQALIQCSISAARGFQWPAKAGWGFRLMRLGALSGQACFNGQQRPDGDSGPSWPPSWPARWSVSMASKGRMGIQGGCRGTFQGIP